MKTKESVAMSFLALWGQEGKNVGTTTYDKAAKFTADSKPVTDDRDVQTLIRIASDCFLTAAEMPSAKNALKSIGVSEFAIEHLKPNPTGPRQFSPFDYSRRNWVPLERCVSSGCGVASFHGDFSAEMVSEGKRLCRKYRVDISFVACTAGRAASYAATCYVRTRGDNVLQCLRHEFCHVAFGGREDDADFFAAQTAAEQGEEKGTVGGYLSAGNNSHRPGPERNEIMRKVYDMFVSGSSGNRVGGRMSGGNPRS